MEALREYLTRNNLSQAEFGKRIGVSQPTVANLVNGMHGASAAVLMRISQETGISTDELLQSSAALQAKAVRHG